MHTLALLFAVWWIWIYTAWVTNWLDPERTSVRLMLFVLMLAGLVLSASIPEAFESQGLPFACAYVLMQVGRTAFMIWALRKHDAAELPELPAHHRLVPGCRRCSGSGAASTRTTSACRLWIVALLIEFCGPLVLLLGAGPRPLAHDGVEHRRRPHGRAVCAVRDHRARRVDSRHRRHRRGAADDDVEPARLPVAPSSAASRCGGSISTSAPSAAATRSRRPRIPGASGGWSTPTCTCSSSPASWSARSRTRS